MKPFILFFIFFHFVSCQQNNAEKKKLITPKAFVKTIKTKSSVLKFDKALVYIYEKQNEIEEIWFYLDKQNQIVLYKPNNDMIDAVISYPNGKYEILGKNELGKKIKLIQQVNEILSKEIEETSLIDNHKEKIIEHKDILKKNILCKGFYNKYLKMEGGETLYATQQIPINSYQIYGFSRLDGDARITIGLDYFYQFSKNQLLTHFERDNESLKLIDFTHTIFEIDPKLYNLTTQ